MIVEMAGRPAKHLTESLENHVGILNKVNDITVHSIKVSEPRKIEMDGVKPGEEMFTAFAECDFEAENFLRLAETMFDFMPSSVEVIEPARVTIDPSESTALLNNISGRMHRYDEIAKIAGARLQQMGAQLQAAQKILIERDEEIAKLKGGKKSASKKKPVAKSNIKKKNSSKKKK